MLFQVIEPRIQGGPHHDLEPFMLESVAKFVETYAVTVAVVDDWLVNIGVSL